MSSISQHLPGRLRACWEGFRFVWRAHGFAIAVLAAPLVVLVVWAGASLQAGLEEPGGPGMDNRAQTTSGGFGVLLFAMALTVFSFSVVDAVASAPPTPSGWLGVLATVVGLCALVAGGVVLIEVLRSARQT